MTREQEYMTKAIELAERGRYAVSPNPMVGCIIVRDGEQIGAGWHHRAGLPHAEINALEGAERSAEGATMFVTLEPCTTHGRTPPCVDAIIAAGVKRVVIAVEDPSLEGAGVSELRDAGIEVVSGVCEREARRQNEKFLRSVSSSRPFILIKAGMSLDGKLATETGQSKWITSPESRQRSLLLREEYDAILVGSRTLATDNPSLTRRLGRSESITPWTRAVLHTEGRIPHDSTLLNDGGQTIIYSSADEALSGETAEQVKIEQDDAIDSVLADLHSRGIRSLIVEGGGRTIGSFLERGLWDRMILFIAPIMIGGKDAPGVSGPSGAERIEKAYGLIFEQVDRAGPDIVVNAVPATS